MKKKDKDKETYTDNTYWDKYWKEENRNGINFYFEDLVDQYINWNNVHSYMEIGGAPGSIMAYMNLRHHIPVSTIDFTDRAIIDDYLLGYGVEDYHVYSDNFLNFYTQEKYDLVASWGFVEHFSKDICSKIIKKKASMMNYSGFMIVELPNIRKIFWLMYFLFNRKLLEIHNCEIMDLSYLKKTICETDMQILYAGYHMAMNVENEYFKKHLFQKNICIKIVNCFSKIKMSNAVKKWFYPYIVIIAKKTI